MIARGLLAALLILVLSAPPAGAHATVVRTFPADGAALEAAPAQARMRFTEPVDLAPGALRLLDANGRELDTPRATHAGGDRTTAVLTLPRGLKDGAYIVAWRVTSADSHPVTGAFSFTVGDSTDVILYAQGGPSSAVEIAHGIARGVAFLGLALAVGGACVLLLLWPEGPRNRRGRRFVWVGVGMLAGGTAALVFLQGPYATGDEALSFTLSTAFGQSLLVRLALTAVFALLVARALRRPDRRLLIAAGACVIGLIATWTLTDHSRTGVQTWLGVPAASAHLLAMTLWFGGLALLLTCVLVREPHPSLVPVVPRFSRLALGCFSVLGATGVYLAWRQAGEFGALPATGFGRLLLIKSGIVLAIIGLAALSRRALDSARRLRRTVAVEAVLGVAVLGVTATLVSTAPARVSYAPPFDATVSAFDGGRLQVHVEPAKQGLNVADVYLFQRDGRLLIPPEVSGRLRRGDTVLPVVLAPAEPGHFIATGMSVPEPGEWELELTVRTSEIDEDVIIVPIRIR